MDPLVVIIIICVAIIAIALPMALITQMKNNPNSKYNEEKNKKKADLFLSIGAKDAKTIQDKFKSLRLSLSCLPDNYENFQAHLEQIRKYYTNKFRVDLKGYSSVVDLHKIKVVYNAKEILVLPQKYNLIDFKHEIGRLGIKYYFYDYQAEKKVYLSLNQLLAQLELLEVYKDAIKIRRSNFYWKLRGFKEDSDAIAGAITGGLLLGSVGAIAGGLTAKKEDTRYVILGDCSGKQWRINTFFEFDKVLKSLCQHFPNEYMK